MTTTVNFSYDRYNVRKRGEFDFEVRNERVSQVLLIPGLQTINLQRTLFGANEVGGIWDWSDRSTMFQDVAGTLPITASGQTRGLHLDKSRGLVLGAELGSGIDFTTWTGLNVSTRSGLTFTTTSSGGVFFNLVPALRTYRITLSGTITNGATLFVRNANHTNGQATVTSPTFNLTMTSPLLFATGGGNLFFQTSTACTVSFSSISIREIPGNHRYQASLASRPQYIEDATGHYGLYDGVDDWDETNAVDFTGTNRMTVWWGGRWSSGFPACLVELGPSTLTTNGTWDLFVSSGTELRFRSRGTNPVGAQAGGFSSPTTQVLTGIGDISGDIARFRSNGIQRVENFSDQGSGNYGNHKIFFGRRGGVENSLNGREYMTIIRGAQTTTPLIERVEREVRRKIRGLTW